MSKQAQINAAEIARQAQTMGAYHGAAFTKAMNAILVREGNDKFSEGDIAVLARDFTQGAATERARILAIDAIVEQMPPGYEALAHAAKFETPIDADEFATQALRAHGQSALALTRMRG